MRPERFKALLPFIKAYAEGKTIQHRPASTLREYPWGDGVDLNFNTEHVEYRIKPTPTLRAWKPEEVPVGALIRDTCRPNNISVILGATVIGNYPRAIIKPAIWGSSNHYLNDLFTYHGGGSYRCEHSLDHGKTWLPCGVVAD